MQYTLCILNRQTCKLTETKTDHSMPKKRLSDENLHIYLYVNAASAGTRPTVEIKQSWENDKITSLCCRT